MKNFIIITLALAAMVMFTMNVQAGPKNNPCEIPGQVPADLLDVYEDTPCVWAAPVSFYMPGTGKLYCQTVFIYGENTIYNVNLKWNGEAFTLLEHYYVDTVTW